MNNTESNVPLNRPVETRPVARLLSDDAYRRIDREVS